MTEQTPAVNDEAGERLHRAITHEWLIHLGYDAAQVHALPDTTEHEVAGCEATPHGYDCTDEDGISRHPLADAADETAALVGFTLTAALPFLSQQVDPREQIADLLTEAERCSELLNKPSGEMTAYDWDELRAHPLRMMGRELPVVLAWLRDRAARETPLTGGGEAVQQRIIDALHDFLDEAHGEEHPEGTCDLCDWAGNIPDIVTTALSPAPEGEKR